MRIIQVLIGLLKLVVTSSKRETSLSGLPSCEPEHLRDTRGDKPQLLHMEQGRKWKKDDSTPVQRLGGGR